MKYKLEQVSVALIFSTGEKRGMSFLTAGRGNILPYGAEWVKPGQWSREPTHANIFAEISSAHPGKDLEGKIRPEVVKYWLRSEQEREDYIKGKERDSLIRCE